MSILFNGITKKIPISKINLKEFFEFYKKEICQYRFKYILEDNTEIIVDFRERNFSHIVGLHKFERIKKYKVSEEINMGLLQIDDFQSLICSALFLLNKKIETIFVISKNFTILFIFL